jgi:hypothetical protein
MSTEVITQPSAEELAGLVASRLVDRLATLQEGGEVPSIVLTGGSNADKVHEAVAEAPERDRVDWGRVEVWFGDERFVPEDSDDRNVLHARRAMLDRLPFDPARVHVMPPSGGERLGRGVDEDLGLGHVRPSSASRWLGSRSPSSASRSLHTRRPGRGGGAPRTAARRGRGA